jgi:predicted RNA binding protein with dsRBD fold (UPF0201 family)
MKKVNSITEEQLTKIQEQQKKLSDLLKDIGFVEVQKHALLHKQAGLNDEIETFKAELEKEYGAITIDIETGNYTEIVKEE